jgi:SAM-dependent methyltransferase
MERVLPGNLSEIDPGKALSELNRRLERIGTDLKDKHILEVGSGRHARLAVQMLHAGADSVSLVDLYAVGLNDPVHRSMLLQDCAALGLGPDETLSRIELLNADFTSLAVPAPDLKADIVTSSAVLEHTHDPEHVLAACWQWLKPGGLTSHVIDLRDHVFETPFEMLTFSDQTWDRWLSPKGGYHLNRWRLPDYLEAMPAAGFVDVQYEVLDRDRHALQKVMPRLNERFAGLEEDALSVLSVHVWGKRPRRVNTPDRG